MNGYKALKAIFFLTFAFASFAQKPPDLRLVVTGGLLGVHSGRGAFYQSPLFRLGSNSRLTIQDTQFQAYTANGTVYFAPQVLTPDEIVQAKPNQKLSSFKALEASQFFAFKKSRHQLIDFEASTLTRELGGVLKKSSYETRSFNGKVVYAVDFSLDRTGVYWPKTKSELESTFASIATNPKGDTYYFFPRQFQATIKVFELVEQLLNNNQSVESRYVDLGNALSRRDLEDPKSAIDMAQNLQKFKPAALALGRYDLGVLPEIPATSPYIGALMGEGAPPISRRVRIGQQEVRFLALGEISDVAAGFLGAKQKALTTRESIEQVKFQADDLLIGLSENRDSAAKAIEYPILDLVLSLSILKAGSLPARDEITLGGNQKLGVRTVAPLVRISSSDVTEVLIWMNSPGQIKKVLIKRHPVVGNVSTFNQLPKPVFRKQTWKLKKFDDLLANILLRAYPNSELVMIESRPSTTPIDASLTEPLAEQLISVPGRAIEIKLGGLYLKQILKAIKEDVFGLDVVVTNTLRRPVSEAETYKILVSEKVLAAVSDFIAQESLFAGTTNPASTVQTALVEGKKDPPKFLAELRKRESKVSVSLEDRYDLLRYSRPVTHLVREALKSKEPIEKPPERSVLIFDISDLDFGFNTNWINDNLSNWQSDANKPNGRATFDENRFGDARYLNMLFYTKMGLYYLMPRLETGLIGSIKYFQPNSESGVNFEAVKIRDIRPGKDSVKIDGEALVPVNWYLSPLFKLTYETQLWPNSLLTNLPRNLWPRRVHDMRLFMGVSPKPWLGTEYFRAGALLGYDFSRDVARQSFGYGFELGAQYRYTWRYLGFRINSDFRKLFPIVDNPAPNRMSIVWLTDARIEIPIIAGFSASGITSITVGERMDQTGSFGVGIVTGLALSYGNNFKWLL